MKKTDKKIENALRKALTEVCDIALVEVDGFQWITHVVHYSVFPDSLSIICVFDTNHHLANALTAHKDEFLYNLIREHLSNHNIVLKNIRHHVRFDTEEDCTLEHGGQWQKRLG